jgi:hypothetical protein
MFEGAPPGDLVEAIAESQRQESVLVARRLAAVAELLGQRTAEAEAEDPDPGYMIITGFQRTTAEVAAAMNLSPMAASFVVSHAEALDTRLPKVAAVLAEGKTDWRTVQLIIARTELVTDSQVVARLDANLAARLSNWHCWSRKRIINAVDAAVRAHDPDAIRERQAAEDRRRVDVTALGDGTAKVDGVVATEAAVAFDRRLSELAAAVCPADPRDMAQRRADAMGALAEGRRLACECGAKDCQNRAEDAEQSGGTRLVINVIANQQTVLGAGNQPGYLVGYGVIDADQVRKLAEKASLRLLQEPTVSPTEALRYQPSAAQERWIRMRDVTCRFPGCDRPAQVCDLDHTIPSNHLDPAAGGLTVPWNLKCVCRQHHRLKTFLHGWTDVQLADGTVIWTSPTGQTYRTTPGGIDLFPELRPPACVAPKPIRRKRSRDRAARIARIRNKNRVQRPVNEAARRLEQARKREIRNRKERNRMRKTLILFKGRQVSTSPFCEWINDPFEAEELPPDWQPPPEPPPLPDDPPF